MSRVKPITDEELTLLKERKIPGRFLNSRFDHSGTERLAAAYEARLKPLKDALEKILEYARDETISANEAISYSYHCARAALKGEGK